jgi:hypothetical protein
MPHDWRKEEEARQAAWNRKLEEDGKKARDFWADKMAKEVADENKRVQESSRRQSTGGSGCAGMLLFLGLAIIALSIFSRTFISTFCISSYGQ